MFSKKRSKPKSQSEEALMSDALSDLLHDQQTKAKRRKKGRFGWPAWLDTRILTGLAVILAIVIGEGVWRENQEFYATVTGCGGDVYLTTEEGGQATPVKVKQKLEDNNVIQTGRTGWAELSFPDGSVVAVDSSSALKVKLLEYHRGGAWRSRSFYLQAGRIFAHVGENFGKDSRMNVYTPACVAAVRGTRFAVAVDPANKQATTVCNDGTVSLRGFNGQEAWVRGGTASGAVAGRSPAAPQTVGAADLTPFQHASMNTIVRTEPWYILLGLTVNQTLDGPLTILGIGRCSWAVGAADFARRTQAMESLRLIRANLEGDATFAPWVNPATLEELGIVEPGAAKRILRTLDGAALESYWSDGRQYRITVRARDKKRTRYEMDIAGIRESQNQN